MKERAWEVQAFLVVKDAVAALAALEDPATELVLTRRCLDVCKVMYTLRSDGGAPGPEGTRVAKPCVGARGVVRPALFEIGHAAPSTYGDADLVGVLVGSVNRRTPHLVGVAHLSPVAQLVQRT